MRYLFIVFLIPVISTCATVEYPSISNGGASLTGIDFREYSEKGFLFTVNSPEGNYESRGLLNVTVFPKIIEIDANLYKACIENIGLISRTIKGEEIEFFCREVKPVGARTPMFYGVESMELSDGIELMYLKANEFGADALTEFNIKREIMHDNGLSFTKIIVSGFAINRLDN